jgi:2-amino-4-hydroxy-6-hydroxymethyldihydropteridine diphosphokinase
MADAYVALGSNLGDRESNLANARDALGQGVLTVEHASSIYQTEPWGAANQGRYLNQVVLGTTMLTPQALLAKLLDIERALGRDRANAERFGPRVIDLDILLYDGVTLKEADLQIPHPRMMERAFVLVPLAEIAPELAVGDVRIKDALSKLDRSGVAPFRLA